MPRFLFKQQLRLAKQGDCSAQEKIGDGYVRGGGTKKNTEEALRWYRQSFDCGNPNAAYKLSVLLEGRVQGKNYLIKAALSGHAEAAEDLAQKYTHGAGSLFPEHEDAALFWTFISSEKNEVAKNRLILEQEKDPRIHAIGKSVYAAYVRAQSGGALPLQQLGELFEAGDWLEKNDEIALWYYEQALDQGAFGAEYYIGTMYYDGRVFKKDTAKGLQMMQQSANKNVPEALFFLGKKAYEEKDFPTAKKYLTKAAEIEHPAAEILLKEIGHKK